MTPNPQQLSNDSLISQLKKLIREERELQLEIIHLLKEVYIRRLHLELGYPSLFAYLTEALGYSEGAAGRRIRAMKLIRELPEVEAKIETGEISLTVASQIQGFVQREDKKRKSQKSQPLTSAQKLDLVQKLTGTSSRSCELKLAELAPETGIPREKTKPLTPERTLIQFAANRDLMAKIQRLKDLTSHSNPEGSYEVLFSKLVEMALERLDPEKREERRQKRQIKSPRNSAPKPSPTPSLPQDLSINVYKGPPKSPLCTFVGKSAFRKPSQRPPHPCPSPQGEREEEKEETPAQKFNSRYFFNNLTSAQKFCSRHIPNDLKDKIWQRDQAKCQFKDHKTGKICGSRFQVQLDHRFPYSLGGEHSERNLRLRCRGHNLHLAGVIEKVNI